MNAPLQRPLFIDDPSNPTLEIRFKDGGFQAITANMLADDAKAKYRSGLGSFLRARAPDPEMLVARDSVDSLGGFRISRDMFGSGTNPATQKPGLGASKIRTEFGLLRNAGMISDGLHLDMHDDESLAKVFDAVTDALANPPARLIDGLKGASLREARRQWVHSVVDTAPNIFLFAELIKRSEILIEEQFTKLYARGIFPVLNLNTWLEMWMFRREGEGAVEPAQPVDASNFPARIEVSASEQVIPIPKLLRCYHRGATWTEVELWRLAEAVANGGTDIDIVRKRTQRAINSLLLAEDNLAFFGDPSTIANGLTGLLSPSAQTGITHTPAAGLFGAGTPEADRLLLIQASESIILQTEEIYQPDTLALGLASWLYVTGTRYGTVDNPSDKLVLDVAMETLRLRGITSITKCPPLGYRPDVKLRYQQQGLATAEASRLAGGISEQHCMATFRKSGDVLALVVGKDITPYPTQTQIHGRTETRYVGSFGGMVFFQPAAIQITTNVGPA